MIILHIVKSNNNPTNGVQVVVPQYVMSQNEFADVKVLNYLNKDMGMGDLQLDFKGFNNFPEYLPSPFNKPDLVVFNEVNNLENLKVAKQLKMRKIPYIIIPHGEITKGALKKKWLKKKIAYTLFFNKFIKGAKAIQCLSKTELESIKIKTPNKFISTNGVYDIATKKTSFSINKMKLVYIGRLDAYHKGLDRLIEGIGLIKNFCLENAITLDIYGPDLYGRQAILEELIKKFDVSDIVKIYKPVLGQDKIKVLLNEDIFIQTSRFEGMPLGVIEAMNLGLPVVLTKGTNLTDNIEENSFGYFAGDSPLDIAQTIQKVYNDKTNWAQKSKKAIEFTLKEFIWSKISFACINKYEEIIKG